MLTVEQFQPVLALYDQGLYLRALDEAQRIAPLKEWRGPAARVMAARLAGNLGSPRLANVLFMLAHREGPDDTEAMCFQARAIHERRGPLAAWEFVRQRSDLPDAPSEHRAHWYCVRAELATALRDFEAAEDLLNRARELQPGDPWWCVARATLLERQDRYSDALAAAREGLQMRPWYRPAVQSSAHILQLLDRDAEAIDLLSEAADRLESGAIVFQLASLQTELGRHGDARRQYDRLLDLSPLIDKKGLQTLCALRSDAAYYCGDHAAAAELAEQAKNPFHEKVAQSLKQAQGPGKRVVLPVGFVRQHHMTCAPATLSAISRFWSMPADHLSVAEKICYDGTPAHSERCWAEDNGWIAREFRVDWESIKALIDRQIPFTFTTSEPASAHLQATIGYDELRGTFICRDPYHRRFSEFATEITLKQLASTGPRGMLMVPRDRAELLDGLVLPEQELYDGLHAVQTALYRHDRDAALAALARLEALDPAHRLTLWARRAICSYDSDMPGLLECHEKLLALYPDDALLKLGRLSLLKGLAPRDQRLALLAEASACKGADPLFWEQYANELREDAREQARAEQLLRRVLRFRPGQASTFHALAGVLWDRREFDRAAELYRFACCLDDKNEGLARSYFIAARHCKQTEQALQTLQDRFARFGRASARPARLLFWAYEQLGREEDGFAMLEEALALRPEDGDLLLLAADALARHGRLSEADARLERARGRAPRQQWLRAAADVALYRGQAAEALTLWKQVVEAEPLAMDAQHRVTQLLSQTQSTAATLEHLDAACSRFPHYYPLLQLRIEWLRGEAPDRHRQAVEQLIALRPADAWARREHVTALLRDRQLDQAAAEAQTGLALAPNAPQSHLFFAIVAARRGELQAACQAARSAIGLSVDYDDAIRHLLSYCDSIETRKEALAFIKSELVRQTIFGDGLLAFRAEAARILDPQALLATLQEALAARPDLWHAWSAVGQQLAQIGRLDEAHETAEAAARRFPLLPRLWLDLAFVCRARGDRDGEFAAIRKALQISPGWSEAARKLSEAHERAGEFEHSRAVLEQAIASNPLDGYAHGMLADVLWRLGQRDRALTHVRRAVELDPGYDWGWHALNRWGRELKNPDLAVQMARDLTQRRAGEARSWLVLARTLNGPQDLEERLSALDRAIELNPRGLQSYDLRAELLAGAGRYEEAIAACNPPCLNGSVPFELRGRAAWVESVRKNYAAAIAQMKAILAEAPRYYWGWCELADWCRLSKDHPEYLRVSETMAATWPLDAKVHGFLGDARLASGDRDGAKAALRQAIERDPEYSFAPEKLFDLQLEDNELGAAEQTLKILQRYHPSRWQTLRAMRLSIAAADRDAALGHLKTLCADPKVDDRLLAEAVDLFRSRKWSSHSDQVLCGFVSSEARSPAVPIILIRRFVRNKHFAKARRVVLRALKSRPEEYRRATHAYIQEIAKLKDAQQVRAYLAIHRRRLRSDDRLWGISGYALHTIRHYRSAIRWLRDWKSRKGVQAWMLVNLAEALRAVGRDREAHEINVHAFALKANPQPHGIHGLWLAADAALDGDAAKASDYLSQVDMSAQEKSYGCMRGFIDALIAALNGGPAVFSDARQQIETAERAYPEFRKDKELRRLYRKCLWKLSALGPGLGDRFWCWRRLAA